MKKILSVLLAILCVMNLTVVSFAAEEDTPATSGTCGENLTWSFDEATGKLTISGEGEITNNPWKDFKLDVKEIEIGKGLTEICEGAFSFCTFLTKVSIPDSVKSIGEEAFYGCYRLESVTIPDSVETVGEYAFDNCESLKTVNIGSGVTELQNPFNFCFRLEEINVDPENTAYFTDEQGVLYNAEKTAIITFPANGGITDYTIPASVVSIEQYDLAFAEDLETLNADPENPVFSSDENGVLYDKDKTVIAVYPVSNRTEKYIVPDSVKTFDYFTFYARKYLTEIVLPEDFEEADCLLLMSCKNLKTVTLGSKAEGLQTTGFAGCTNLEKIIVSEDNPYYSTDENGVLYNKDKSVLIYVPAKSFEDSFVIPETVVSAEYDAFIDCKDFSLSIPATLTEDGDFLYNVAVNEFIVSEDHQYITAIDGVLFSKGENGELELVKYPVYSDRQVYEIPENVVEIGPEAFVNINYSYVLSLSEIPLVEPEDEILITPESLTVHYNAAPGCSEDVFAYLSAYGNGINHLYVSGDYALEDLSKEETLEYIKEFTDEIYISEEDLEKEIADMQLNVADFYRRYYKEIRESLPDVIDCSGDHTQKHPYTSVTTQPTCVLDGETVYSCECGDSYTETIPAKGHTWGEGVTATEPTCVLDGTTVYSCECGESYTESIPATGHTWSEWTVETEPTEDSEGVQSRTCSGCGEKEEVSIPKLDKQTFFEKIAAFFGKIGDFFVMVFDWIANLFKF